MLPALLVRGRREINWDGVPNAAAAPNPLGAAAAILGVGAAIIGTLLLGRAALDRIPFAIVLAEEVPVKEGADPNYRTSFQVHAGLKVRLLDRDHEWVRIRLPNGLEGWVRDGSVGRL
jgi:SH3-like domain-containing protein